MANLVLVIDATEQSSYSASHITYLLRKKLVKGKKRGGVWLVDLDDLKLYEQAMSELGTKKFDPTRAEQES